MVLIKSHFLPHRELSLDENLKVLHLQLTSCMSMKAFIQLFFSLQDSTKCTLFLSSQLWLSDRIAESHTRSLLVCTKWCGTHYYWKLYQFLGSDRI